MDICRTLFVIPCCKKKLSGGINPTWEIIRNNPQDNQFSILDEHRKRLVRHYSDISYEKILRYNPQLRGACPEYSTWCKNQNILKCGTMMAIDRYIGMMYSPLNHNFKIKIINREIDNIWIASALMGLLLPTDLIPDYELSMMDHGPDNDYIHNYWNLAYKTKDVKSILKNKLLQFDRVICLLSKSTGYVNSIESLLDGQEAYFVKSKTRGMANVLNQWANIMNECFSNINIHKSVADIVKNNNCELISFSYVVETKKEKSMQGFKIFVPDEGEIIPKISDQIRKYIKENVIDPQRIKGNKFITIKAGDIAKACNYRGINNINQILGNPIIEEICKIRLIKKEGNTGSTTGSYTYEILYEAHFDGEGKANESIVYCNKCGKDNPDNANYCSKCGYKLIN